MRIYAFLTVLHLIKNNQKGKKHMQETKYYQITDEYLEKMDRYWNAVNYLAADGRVMDGYLSEHMCEG